ncbi:MAG: ATP-binding protein [Actinobacteria bacterium]|nr:ATP-binding protein [Actinomycetota bacterium]
MDFIGRAAELSLLRKRLDRVISSGSGTAVALRGRRQVGKSRLVQEFCDQAGTPYFFFTATKGASPVESVREFCLGLRDSSLPGEPDLVPVLDTGSWPDAFRVLRAALPDSPAIVVLDELPWLAEQDQLFDGALQTAWDRMLSPKPVLMCLLGSDIHMMERLTAYDQPFFGRADTMALGPLSPAETADALELADHDAIDAHLVSGGLPGILRSWPRRVPALEFLRSECKDPAAPVFGVPESALLAEFQSPGHSRRVLEAVGSGDRTQSAIAAAAGGAQGPLPSGALSPLMRRLVAEKRVLAVDEPLSTRPGRPALYRIADTNLRLYLAVLRGAHEFARRGQAAAAYRLIERRWTSWRGRAVEPLVRHSLERAGAAGALPWPGVEAVGGWWNRQFRPEIDLIGADRAPIARRVFFAGSVKWLGSPFDDHDLAELGNAAAAVPGFVPGESGLVIASRSGVHPSLDARRVDLVWGPGEIVAAWRAGG